MATNHKPTDAQRCLLACVARIGTTEPAAVFADCGMRGAALSRTLDALSAALTRAGGAA